jgi:hypothetical protein
MQLHDTVFELDEPRMVQPTDLDGLPAFFRRLEGYLGFQYITLRTFASAPGSLDGNDSLEATVVLQGALTPSPEPTPTLAGAAR